MIHILNSMLIKLNAVQTAKDTPLAPFTNMD